MNPRHDRLFDRPAPSFGHLIAREERRIETRYRDHSTAQSFSMRGTPAPVFDAAPLFDHHEPERGPEPLPGQTALDVTPPPPTASPLDVLPHRAPPSPECRGCLYLYGSPACAPSCRYHPKEQTP